MNERPTTIRLLRTLVVNLLKVISAVRNGNTTGYHVMDPLLKILIALKAADKKKNKTKLKYLKAIALTSSLFKITQKRIAKM